MRAFKRALALDPGYALAFEHVNYILGRASRQNPMWVLLPGDSIAMIYDDKEKRVIDSAATTLAVTRARAEAIRLARDWANLQPATAKAHEALLAALIAAQDYDGAGSEVARFRAVVPNHPELAFDDARIRFASGDAPRAARQLGASIDSLTPRTCGRSTAPRTPPSGSRSRPTCSRTRATSARRRSSSTSPIESASVTPRRDRPMANERDAWNWRMQGELYAAVGCTDRRHEAHLAERRRGESLRAAREARQAAGRRWRRRGGTAHLGHAR